MESFTCDYDKIPDDWHIASCGVSRNRMFVRLLLIGLCGTASFGASYNFVSNLAIPDGNANGIQDIRSIAQSFEIGSVAINLNISGIGGDGFNGDLYVYLRHNTGFSVLLNRSGKTASDASGYGDNGFQIRLQDGVSNGDIHSYQMALTPVPGDPVTGTWQPDARNVDPSIVTELSSRSAFLSNFSHLDAQGNWTLFLADMDGGSGHRLDSWGLEFMPVPEPAEWGAMVAVGLLLFGVYRKNQLVTRPKTLT